MSATRSALTGAATSWASPDALEPCPHCDTVHPADWIHVPAHCRRPPRRRAEKTIAAPPADELGAAVLAVLRRRGPVSGREVLRRVPRRAVDVRAALRKLEAAGLARRGDNGWAVTR